MSKFQEDVFEYKGVTVRQRRIGTFGDYKFCYYVGDLFFKNILDLETWIEQMTQLNGNN